MTRAVGIGLPDAGARASRAPVVIALMASIALVSMDTTIVATAVPQMTADLGGLGQAGWIFSAYLLAQSVTIPIYGKCADVIGRKSVLLTGIALFVAGSALCAAAWSLPALAVFRAVQGLGGGAINGTVNTLAGDLFALHERARIQALLSSVWAVAAIVAPAVGGIAVEYMSWRWIFIINVPLGAVAFAMLVLRLREPDRSLPGRRGFDYTGAIALMAMVTTLNIALLMAGTNWGWASNRTYACFALGAVFAVALLYVECQASDPIAPAWIWRSRATGGACLIMLVSGLAAVGLSNFLPAWGQTVLGLSPLDAGFLLASMSLAWPIGSVIAARLCVRVGFRSAAMLGAALMVGSATSFALTAERASPIQPVISGAVMGLGLGLVTVPMLVGAQNDVDWCGRGVATGSLMFSRQLGQTFGASLFGALSSLSLRHRLGPAAVTAGHGSAALAVSPAVTNSAQYRGAVNAATHSVFVGVLVVSITTMVLVAAMINTDFGSGGERRSTETVADAEVAAGTAADVDVGMDQPL